MTKISLALVVVLMFSFLVPAASFAGATDPGQGGDPEQGSEQDGKKCCLWEMIKKLLAKPTPEQQAELLAKLLVLAKKDLELAAGTIEGKGCNYFKNVIPAIGHLNHALSAIGKGKPPKHLKPAFKELTKRISHAKFYLVANDLDEARSRIDAAADYIGELN